MELIAQNYQPFLLVFFRVAGIFLLTPIFSSETIPYRIKPWMAFFIALLLYPMVQPSLPPVPENFLGYVALLVVQTAIGLTIGLFLAIMYTAFQLAGQFYSLQIGFGLINVIDPISQTQLPIVGQLKGLVALILFLYIGGHHMLLRALVHSFTEVPTLTLAALPIFAAQVLKVFVVMFETAFHMAIPVIAVIFVIEVILGILSKTAPQMNVMVLGFQIKVVAGLVTIMLILPLFWRIGSFAFMEGFANIEELIQRLAWSLQ